jgi:xanthine dehydrogenase accessory factor
VTGPDLLGRAAALDAGRVPYVWATVVHAEAPASTRAGDTALVRPDGTIEGFVGGSCAEATVRQQSLEALAGGTPKLVRISPEATGADPASATGDRPGLVRVANPCLSGGTIEVFLEPRLPAPLLVVHGTAPIAQALRAGGAALGFATRGGDQEAPLTPDAAAVVVATHGRGEEALLAGALGAGVPYVGLVASRRRGAAVLAGLDVEETARDRVHTPAGLAIGAATPEEVALSILAEIVASRPRPRRGTGEHDEGMAPGPGEGTATAVDPVCGMTVVAAPPSPWADHDGARRWFCGPGCRQAFVHDPTVYAAP